MSALPQNVVALVGLRALERALTEAADDTVLCAGTDIPFYPRLSVRSNARAVRMLLPEEKQKLFWELLKVSGLRRSGWNVAPLKGNTGAQRLWGLVLELTKQPPALLALEPMTGMGEKERRGFADLLRWCGERGVSLSFTAVRLKEVMELGVDLRLRLALPGGWEDTDAARMEEALAGEEEKSWNRLQRKWEGEDCEIPET